MFQSPELAAYLKKILIKTYVHVTRLIQTIFCCETHASVLLDILISYVLIFNFYSYSVYFIC